MPLALIAPVAAANKRQSLMCMEQLPCRCRSRSVGQFGHLPKTLGPASGLRAVLGRCAFGKPGDCKSSPTGSYVGQTQRKVKQCAGPSRQNITVSVGQARLRIAPRGSTNLNLYPAAVSRCQSVTNRFGAARLSRCLAFEVPDFHAEYDRRARAAPADLNARLTRFDATCRRRRQIPEFQSSPEGQPRQKS
jgi:hypothetical protein